MTESPVVNDWISQGQAKGWLASHRQKVLEVLDLRFPGATPAEVVHLMKQQESLALLNDWFRAALSASTFDQFLAVLNR